MSQKEKKKNCSHVLFWLSLWEQSLLLGKYCNTAQKQKGQRRVLARGSKCSPTGLSYPNRIPVAQWHSCMSRQNEQFLVQSSRPHTGTEVWWGPGSDVPRGLHGEARASTKTSRASSTDSQESSLSSTSGKHGWAVEMAPSGLTLQVFDFWLQRQC